MNRNNLQSCTAARSRVSSELQIINRGKMTQEARKLVYICNLTSSRVSAMRGSIANGGEPDVPRWRATYSDCPTINYPLIDWSIIGWLSRKLSVVASCIM